MRNDANDVYAVVALVTLGIDVGQSLGWARVEDGELAQYGTLRIKRGASHLDNIARFAPVLEDVDAVCIEDVQFSRFVQAHASYWRVRTLAEVAIETYAPGAKVHSVPVSTLKEWACGHGHGGKGAMVTAANARCGLNLAHLEDPRVLSGAITKAQAGRDQDMADAIHAAFFGEKLATHKNA